MECCVILDNGLRCGSKGVCKDDTQPNYGYCYFHARSKGLLPKEKMKEWNEKIGAGRKKVLADKEKEKREPPTQTKADADKEALKLYHAIAGDKNFDLAEMVKQKAEITEDFFKKEIWAQGMFIMWHFADPATRTPVSLKEVAKILQVREIRIREWMATDWLTNEMKKRRLTIHNLFLPLVDRANIVEAIGADRNAIKQFYEQAGPMDIKPVEPEENPDFMKKCEEEVAKTSDGGGVYLSKEEDELQDQIIEEEE